jgi:hypothetical protein
MDDGLSFSKAPMRLVKLRRNSASMLFDTHVLVPELVEGCIRTPIAH